MLIIIIMSNNMLVLIHIELSHYVVMTPCSLKALTLSVCKHFHTFSYYKQRIK